MSKTISQTVLLAASLAIPLFALIGTANAGPSIMERTYRPDATKSAKTVFTRDVGEAQASQDNGVGPSSVYQGGPKSPFAPSPRR